MTPFQEEVIRHVMRRRAGAGDIAPMPGASGKWEGVVCETGAAGAGNGVASRLGGV